MRYLYKITNQLSGKVYIGQSNKETERWRQHKYFARQEKPIQYIHRAMSKHGIDNFTYEVIAMCITQEDADFTEIQLINQYDCRNKKYGYNLAPGGNVTWKSGMPPHMYPMYGKHHTEEHKKYMSNLFKGKRLAPPTSPETRQKLSDARTDIILSEETKTKISIAHTGKILSDEHKRHISDAKIGTPGTFTGKQHTEKTKALISKKGRKFNEETERYISKLHYEGISIEALSAKYNCGWRTIYRIIKRNS